MLYKKIIKPILFRFDPENVHDAAILLGRVFASNPLTRGLTRILYHYKNPALQQKVLGIDFENPVGLAAGFDKDGYLTRILPDLGFGFEEVGSVTALPCKGNPRPRLWRLPKSQGLVINYGLKNDGSEKIAKRLQYKKFRIPIAISIAKTNCKATVDEKNAILDYKKSLEIFSKDKIGDFYIINISCPNTFGGEPFTSAKKLDHLLTELKKVKTSKPILIKIAPDLTNAQLDQIIKVAQKQKIAGFVCTNLTKKFRPGDLKDPYPGIGSISGKFIEKTANRIISHIYKKTKGEFVIIGVGGIFSAADAYKKIRLGASLVQLITGMIFEGPALIKQINRDLTKLLQRDGFKNISEAIGADHHKQDR